jgi:molecular chaperone DnaJ
MAKDFYSTLGVSRDADTEQIKKAYRRLAMEYHPDRNSDASAEDRFKEVTQAYEILRDPEKRNLYDRYGEAGVRRGAPGQTDFGFGGFSFSDAFDVFMREFGAGGFGDLFGARSRPSGPRRGSTLRLTHAVTLEEAARGVERTLKLAVLDPCDRCDGSGAEPGTSPATCATCGGAGEVRQVQRSVLGQFVSVRPCPTCRGEGTTIENPCTTCRGESRVRRDKKIKIDIPPGISSDDYLKLREKGNAGTSGGPRGDVIVQIEVEPHERFERHGDDLLYDLAINFSQAALGADVEVPTIDGSAQLTIPAGIQSGQVLRMRGSGLPRLRSTGRGDQLVRVRVWTPTKVTDDQKKALERLAEVEKEPPEPRRDDPGFWERVKAAFTA